MGNAPDVCYNLLVSATRRGARVDDWGGLENRCGLHGHRGFESHPLRLSLPPPVTAHDRRVLGYGYG